MTERLFLDHPTLAIADAVVLSSSVDGIVLDRTIFYARSGGQPGDTGTLNWDGGMTAVADTVNGDGESILHLPSGTDLPATGTPVRLALDWPRRQAMMRMHTALHLLCAVLPGAGVTGGQIGPERSRLDFDLPEPPAKAELQARLDALIAADHPVRTEWVDSTVLDDNPGLVRSLSVQPPRGAGRLRLVRIGDGKTPVDLQPCGGTHVASTGEIGAMTIVKIENKGRQNRRITISAA